MKQINQHGTIIIEVILAVIVILAVGATIYTSRQKDAASNKAANNATVASTNVKTTPSSPNSADVYKDWKTYTSVDEGLTFRYPSDWKLVFQPPDQGDAVKITSPSGFTLEYISAASGLGGGCMPPECPDVQTYVVEKLAAANAPSDLYYVEGSFKNNSNNDPNKGKFQPIMGLISKTDTSSVPTVGEQLQTGPYYFTAQKRNTKIIGSVMFDFNPAPTQTSKSTSLQASQAAVKSFFNTADVKTARLILESVKY